MVAVRFVASATEIFVVQKQSRDHVSGEDTIRCIRDEWLDYDPIGIARGAVY